MSTIVSLLLVSQFGSQSFLLVLFTESNFSLPTMVGLTSTDELMLAMDVQEATEELKSVLPNHQPPTFDSSDSDSLPDDDDEDVEEGILTVQEVVDATGSNPR